MKTPKIIFPLIFMLLLLSCSHRVQQAMTTANGSVVVEPIHLDTSNYAVIALDVYRKKATPTDLSAGEIHEIETLLNSCINAANHGQPIYNSWRHKYAKSWFYEAIHPKDYKVTFEPFINEKSEKIVEVSGYCNDYCNTTNWRLGGRVCDGGSCFFELTINLTTHKYYDFSIHGVA